MLKKNHRQRGRLLLARMVLFSSGVGCILWGLSSNISAFVVPKQLKNDPDICSAQSCRLGAVVKPNSINWQRNRLSFIAQDNSDHSYEITVQYQGLLPSLFKEGAMMLAEGSMQNGVFQATRILAKHDENYQPPTH